MNKLESSCDLEFDMCREIESGEEPDKTEIITVNKKYDDQRKADNKRK
jgi:hypothetical protein